MTQPLGWTKKVSPTRERCLSDVHPREVSDETDLTLPQKPL
jgi:hypothetical protein